jgi:hypothetical protein
MNKTQEFIDCAFSIPANMGVKCPYNRCRNALCEDKRTLTMHRCKFGFMLDYEVGDVSQRVNSSKNCISS